MDQVSKVGVIPPPEYPELPAPGPLVAAPDAEHVGLEAAAEAAQDGILLRHREQDGGRRWALPHVTLPFNPSEISLRGEKSCQLAGTSSKHIQPGERDPPGFRGNRGGWFGVL